MFRLMHRVQGRSYSSKSRSSANAVQTRGGSRSIQDRKSYAVNDTGQHVVYLRRTKVLVSTGARRIQRRDYCSPNVCSIRMLLEHAARQYSIRQLSRYAQPCLTMVDLPPLIRTSSISFSLPERETLMRRIGLRRMICFAAVGIWFNGLGSHNLGGSSIGFVLCDFGHPNAPWGGWRAGP